MLDTYEKAFCEVLEIIKYVPEEEKNKIPIADIEFMRENADPNYCFKIDPNRNIEEQISSKKTNAIIIMLFKKYFATEEQKALIQDILILNKNKSENLKVEKYNIDIFNMAKEKYSKPEIKEETHLAKVEDKSFFRKIINNIKKFLKFN